MKGFLTPDHIVWVERDLKIVHQENLRKILGEAVDKLEKKWGLL